MNPVSRAPLQARSRLTTEQLLASTLAVIEEKGVAGVTIPEVALRAGLSPGSVYRRFDDKEAMIRIALLRFLEASRETNEASLPSGRLLGLTLEEALIAFEGVVIVVSHDLPSLAALCDRVLWLDHGHMRMIGPTQEVIAAYTREVNESRHRQAA